MTIIFRGISTIRNLLQNIYSLFSGKPVKKKKTSSIFEQCNNMNNTKNPFNNQEEKVDPEEDIYVDFEEIKDDEDEKE